MAAHTASAYTRPAVARTPFGARQAWSLVCAMLQARRTRRILAEMDAHQLADIGASRGEAQFEAARPFWDLVPRRK